MKQTEQWTSKLGFIMAARIKYWTWCDMEVPLYRWEEWGGAFF